MGSASDVSAQRESCTETPSWKKFLVLDATTAIAKSRSDLLQRKVSEEKSRINEAEKRAQPAKKGEENTQTSENKLSKKAKKRLKQKERRKRNLPVTRSLSQLLMRICF